MDFQEYVEGFYLPTLVVSVKRMSEGKYGDIRLVAGNAEMLKPVEHPSYPIAGILPGEYHAFIPNSPYDHYLPKDIGFEDYCYRGAVLKENVHTYVYLNKVDSWFGIDVTPMKVEDGDVCYCAFSMKPSDPAELDLGASKDGGTAEDVLRTCIKLRRTDDFKKTMGEILGDVRELCGAEVCTVMLVDSSAGTCSVLATNIRPGSRIKRVTQFVNFYDIATSWLTMIGDGDRLIVKTEQDMEYVKEVNLPWYLTLVEAGVRSVVLFPMHYRSELLGFIWATNFDERSTQRIQETLELTTFFISSEIAGQRMVEQLKHISYTDMLTGVKNRNAMNNRVTDIVSGTEYLQIPFGVIFADLNGLKCVNDLQGHAAGDLLLKKAALLLQEIFAQGDVYRAGGDEFVAFLPDISREDFEDCIRTLKSSANDPENVCFAVGGYYVESGCDIRDAMRLADEDMYRNKEQYYREHPERKNH